MQQLLANYLVNAAWQIPVVALCAVLAARFGGFSPQGRNRLWLASLAIAAILPAVSLAALLPHAKPTVARVPAEAVALAAFQAMAPATEALVPAAEPAAMPALELTAWSAWAISALAAAGVLILVLRLGVAARAASRLVRQSNPVVLPRAIAQDLERLASAHRRAAAPVRSSPRISSPAVVGAFSPVILIPEGSALQEDDLRAALLHEMAHVVRHDYAVNVACEVLTLPICWHPALMGLKAGVAKSRELACDAMAAEALGSPKTYARRLVSLAQTLGAQTAPVPFQTLRGAPAAGLAVGLFGRSDLEDRLMHLMKPKDTEAPAIRAARLCGLAAVGAGLLGSAALLHVTPVFAQPASAAPVTAAPLASPSPAATTAISQAQTDAAVPAAPAHHRRGVIINKDGVTLELGGTGYRHSFAGSDGREITVTNDDPNPPTAEQERRWEADVRDAEAKGAAAEAMINSPEFKARIAKAQEEGRKAEAMVNSPEFKAKIAKAQEAGRQAEAMVNSPEFKARIAAAAKAGADAEAMVNSPEFKARIAKAQEEGRKAEAMVNSPEFKARIAAAQKAGADAEKMVNSPEFKAKIARAAQAGAQFDTPEFRARMAKMEADLNAMGERMAHQFDDFAPSAPTP